MQNTKERKRVYRIISWVLTVVMVIATLNLGGIPASKVFAVDYDEDIVMKSEVPIKQIALYGGLLAVLVGICAWVVMNYIL